jgi:hypothetical protein
VRDRDGAYIISATVDATGARLCATGHWSKYIHSSATGETVTWEYDEQASIVRSHFGTLHVDGSVWRLDGVGVESQGLLVFVSPLGGYVDAFTEKGGEKGEEKGRMYTFEAKGADVHHGMQLVATATSNNYARRIAEALTLYRGKLSLDRRDQRRRAERAGQ